MTQHLEVRHNLTMGDYHRVCFFGNRSVNKFRNVCRFSGGIAGFQFFEQGTAFRNPI
jgi:hypothetical protein